MCLYGDGWMDWWAYGGGMDVGSARVEGNGISATSRGTDCGDRDGGVRGDDPCMISGGDCDRTSRNVRGVPVLSPQHPNMPYCMPPPPWPGGHYLRPSSDYSQRVGHDIQDIPCSSRRGATLQCRRNRFWRRVPLVREQGVAAPPLRMQRVGCRPGLVHPHHHCDRWSLPLPPLGEPCYLTDLTPDPVGVHAYHGGKPCGAWTTCPCVRASWSQ